MIVQAMALRHGPRLRSMVSIMSSTGNPDLPKSTPEASAALLSPAGTTLEEVLERAVQVSRAIGSPAYRDDPESIRARARADFERSFYPVGVARQMAAIAASGNRRPTWLRSPRRPWSFTARTTRWCRWPVASIPTKPFRARGSRCSRAWGTICPNPSGRMW
jgi:pimeloyl-ACP methyl ester carboxylesterase